MTKTEITVLPKQLKLTPLVHTEIEGIEMGVLPDGTPYLSSRGLAKLCGVAPSVIITLTSGWTTERWKPRGVEISALLEQHGHGPDELFVRIEANGTIVHAHPDSVCMALLEYYAFIADTQAKHHAQRGFRMLARYSLREFVYKRTGFDPLQSALDSWRHYHDRVVLNDLPSGYFSVFREIADVIVGAIRAGLVVDTHTVPDISVGRMWSQHWGVSGLTERYGERIKHPHHYPDYFPQAKATTDAWIYPLEALGTFRLWMQQVYLPTYFPSYLEKKAAKGVFPPQNVPKLLEVLVTGSGSLTHH